MILDNYLRSNGKDGIYEWLETVEGGIGGDSVMTDGTFNCGLGTGRGEGGDVRQFTNQIQNGHNAGIGGCLYILSTNVYSICEITNVPNDATINLNVSNDSLTLDGNTVFLNASIGNINGTGSKKFITKKDATIDYDVVSNDGHWIANGTITNVGTPDSNLGTYDADINTHTIPISLNKRILTHTISSAGSNITVRGNFTDLNGNITSNELTGTGSITFNVWSAEPNVNYTVSRTYYDTKTGSVTVTTDNNGGTTGVSLDKHKYYATLSQTGEITFKNGTRDITASWNNWSDEEKSKASGTRWKCTVEGFDYNIWGSDSAAFGGAEIIEGQLNYSNNLPNSKTITFFTDAYYWLFGNVYLDTTFTIGNIYVEIDE